VDLGARLALELKPQAGAAGAADHILFATFLLHCLSQQKLLLLAVEELAALLCLVTAQTEILELLEATLRSELGFKWLVEVEPELLQPQVVQPAPRQVRVLCLSAEMVLLVLAALAQVAQTAIRQEQVVEVEEDFPQAQQLGLLAATAALLLDLGCQEELLQEG